MGTLLAGVSFHCGNQEWKPWAVSRSGLDRFREVNNRAVKRCREKKKAEIKAKTDEYERLKEKNQTLRFVAQQIELISSEFEEQHLVVFKFLNEHGTSDQESLNILHTIDSIFNLVGEIETEIHRLTV